MKTLSLILLHWLILLSPIIGHNPVSAQAILPPNAVDDAETINPGTTRSIRVLANDSDPQNFPLKVVAITTPANGTAAFNDSTVIYTPSFGYSGIDTFQYTISNGVLTSSAFVDAIVLPPPGTIWEDDIFNPLTTGALSGQNGWTTVAGLASPSVITDLDPNRGKTVQIDAAPGQAIGVTKIVPEQTSGRHTFSFLVKVSGAAHDSCEAAVEIQTDPSTGWTNKARFCLGSSLTVNYNPSGATATLVASTVPEQWYYIQAEMNLNTNLLEVWVDGQLKVADLPVHPGPIRSVGITGQDQGSAGVVYVDDFTGISSYGIAGSGGGTGTPGLPVYWINSAGGLWSNPANWSTRRVPAADEHAIITLGGNYTVTVDNSTTVNSLTLGAGFDIQTLSIKGNSSHANVTLTVNNDIRNSSLILLESTSGWGSTLKIVNGLLTNNFVVRVNAGTSGGTRTITGKVLNRCRTDIKQTLTFEGVFTNRAMLEIDTTKQMNLNGGAQVFNQNGGEISGKGMLELLNGATMNFNRGATRGPLPPLLSRANLNFGPSATGRATLIMRGAPSQLTGDIGAEQIVWLRGDGFYTDATVTAPNSFRNAGELRFQSLSGWGARLNMNGTLTNTSSGVVNINQGNSGGVREISGTLVNAGSVNVNPGANLTLNFKGTFTNFSALKIDSLQFMLLDGNTNVFNQNAGTIASNGLLEFRNGATMNFSSGATTGANPPLLSRGNLSFSPPATGRATFIMRGGPSRLSGDLGAEQTVWLRGDGFYTDATVTAKNNFKNAGEIRLESLSGWGSRLLLDSTLTNTGVINVNQGNSGGAREIAGALINQNAVNVNRGANLILNFNGVFTNFAALKIDSLQTMLLNGGAYVFNQYAGTIGGNGRLELQNGATMNFTSGATTGVFPPLLSRGNLNFGPPATGRATFIMRGAPSQLRGDIGAEQIVWLRGDGFYTDATVTAKSHFKNAGEIRLESLAGWGSRLLLDSTLTNTGVINVNQGNSGGGREISGTLINHGAVNVNRGANLTLNFKGTFTNFSALKIDSLQFMLLDGNTHTFNQNEGTIAGNGLLELRNGATMNFSSGATTGTNPPLLSRGNLRFAPPATGRATFIMRGAPSQLSGDLGAEQVVWLRGDGFYTDATVTAKNNFKNADVIRLESLSGWGSKLNLDSTLINTGLIHASNPRSAGRREIAGRMLNRGLLTIDSLQTLLATGALFKNDSGGAIQGKGTLNVLGTTFTNAGEFRPGTSPGILSITGPFPQTATGALSTEIGGLIVGREYDRLQVSDVATLSGTLNISVIDSSAVALGRTFQILTCRSHTGEFDIVNGRDLGNGLRFKVNYNNLTNVTLEIATEEAIANLNATNNGPTPLDSVTTFRASVFAGSNVRYVWNFGDSASDSGAVATHTYTTPGTYTVIVAASNTLGSVADTTVVTVFVVPISGLTATNNGPTPVDSVTVLTASVTAGSRVSYTWNFGDGTPTVNGAVVNHIYRTAGAYAAVVTATNAVSTFTDTTTVTIIPASAVDEFENAIPTAFVLKQNYPNPFNPSTTIRYAIPKASHVTLTVYDLVGKEVATLVSKKQPAGEHVVGWNPVGLPSGVYVYRLQTEETSPAAAQKFVATKKLILLK